LFELGKTSGYSFAYFTKEKLFTKSHLIQELSQFEEAKKFIPDDINPLSLSRNYLFTILETISPQRYVQLYQIYKEKCANKHIEKWSNYQVFLDPVIVQKIKEFKSVEK